MPQSKLSPEKKKITKKSSGARLPALVRKLTIFSFLALVVWLLISQLWGIVLHQLANHYEVEKGTLERELIVDRALLIRDEMVFFAPSSGELTWLIPEGERVAEGEEVARIYANYGASQGVKATQAGIVCYHPDGLEKVLTPEVADTLNLSELEISRNRLAEISSGTQVERGQPVLRIINNLKPSFIWFEFDVEHLKEFPNEGNNINFWLGEQECQGKLAKLEPQGIVVRALLELDRGNFMHERELELRLILESVGGLKIPNKAIVDSAGNQGVFKVLPTGYRYTPLTIQFSDEKHSIVEGLSRGDQIITNPGLFKDKLFKGLEQ